MNTMQYKGYTASINFDEDDDIFVGRVVGIRDIIAFHADNVADLKKEFAEMIDFYLESCARDGEEPNKPTSNKLTLRIAPRVRAAINAAAERAGTSTNRWAEAARAQAAGVTL